MDSLITAAARALAAGDVLGALKRVALRDDAPALALRGIAMAQLGDLMRAKALLRQAGREADIPALTAEVESASLTMDRPAARLIARGRQRLLLLDEVEALFSGDALVVDACRNVVRSDRMTISLATRPVLFAIVRAL